MADEVSTGSHEARPAFDEWLDSLGSLAPAPPGVSGAAAVSVARAADDGELARAVRA